jgi:hypothetical protein
MKDDKQPAKDDHDTEDAVVAADDTGMLAGERAITLGEIAEAEAESNQKPKR